MRVHDTLERLVDVLVLTGTPEAAEKAWETRREGLRRHAEEQRKRRP